MITPELNEQLLAIANEYEAPVYVYHAETILNQYNKLINAFKPLPIKIKYACKALNNSAILVKQVNPNSQAQTQQLRIESDKLRINYDLFLKNKLDLDNLIRENADLENEYKTTSIMVKQSNLSYFFWSVGAIVIIIITIRYFYKNS